MINNITVVSTCIDVLSRGSKSSRENKEIKYNPYSLLLVMPSLLDLQCPMEDLRNLKLMYIVQR